MRKLLVVSLLSVGLLLQIFLVPGWAGSKTAFQAGGDIRWRYVVTTNIFDFKDDSGVSIDTARYYRNRIRLWTKFGLSDKISSYIRITAEPWWGAYFKNDGGDVQKTRWPLEFDNAYLLVKDAFIDGLTIKLGRQDLIYGEGFVILDGTPADGSRTIFHDGVKLTYALDKSTSVDLFGMIIQENDYGLDDDLDMQGLYLTSNGIFNTLAGHKLELYALRSHRGGDIRDPDDPNKKIEGDADDIYAPGFRISGALADKLVTYAAEFNYQIGGTSKVSRQGMGFYAHATLNPGVKVEALKQYAPALKGGYYFLSGDDPATKDTNEGFFHFTNQWPKYSDLYIYPLLGPTLHEAGWWTNMNLIEAQLSVKPTSKLTLAGRVGLFGAQYANIKDGVQSDGTNRGTMIRVQADCAFTPALSGQLLGEWFLPGDYYTFKGQAADPASFLRAMVFVKF